MTAVGMKGKARAHLLDCLLLGCRLSLYLSRQYLRRAGADCIYHLHSLSVLPYLSAHFWETSLYDTGLHFTHLATAHCKSFQHSRAPAQRSYFAAPQLTNTFTGRKL